jgi:hypothetical protein
MVHLPSKDMTSLAALAALAAALRGEPPAMALTDELVDVAVANGVAALLARSRASAAAPPAVASRLTAMMAGHEALSAVRDRELVRVLETLAGGGISPVLIKGAHLAHTIYASPAERPRDDTDFVIAQDEQAVTASLLAGAGYRRPIHVRGTMILGQSHFQRIDDLGIAHALDVHWRLAAPLVFRRTLPAATLRASRAPVPGLGPHAWGPSRPHALIVACVHLVAHHRVDPVLLWLYEIARMAETLEAQDAVTFLETADAAGIGAVCASALDRSRRYFDGPALASLSSRARARSAPRAEPSARLLTATRPLDDMWLDFRIAEGWRERLTLLREHLFPDVAYMRATGVRQGWLPLAYARRAAFGIRKWTARAGGTR